MCMRCELVSKFGWLHHVEIGEMHPGTAKLTLFHSYPEAINIEPEVRAFLEPSRPANIELELELVTVTPEEGERLAAEYEEEVVRMAERYQPIQAIPIPEELREKLTNLLKGRDPHDYH